MTAVTESAVFTALHSVTSAQLDEVTAGFTAEQWHHLETAFLDQVAMDVLGYLDTLGFDFNGDTDDAVVIFWRLYRLADQMRQTSFQTTGGIR